jgi:hypothetical protein
MNRKLITLKKNYYNYLDRKARHLACKLLKKQAVTKLILDYIKELYASAKIDNFDNAKFKSAYHNPISSDLEFLIARLLYHYSNFKKLDWEIYLRSQSGKTAPDIRIGCNKKTLAIIEVKAKAGWIQPFFSKETYNKAMKKLRQGKSGSDPRDLIKKQRGQFKKYYEAYHIKPKQIFVFLPTLALVHRKKSKQQVDDYENQFVKNSGLPNESLILLSNNRELNLSSNSKRKEYKQTSKFEKFITTLNKHSK